MTGICAEILDDDVGGKGNAVLFLTLQRSNISLRYLYRALRTDHLRMSSTSESCATPLRPLEVCIMERLLLDSLKVRNARPQTLTVEEEPALAFPGLVSQHNSACLAPLELHN